MILINSAAGEALANMIAKDNNLTNIETELLSIVINYLSADIDSIKYRFCNVKGYSPHAFVKTFNSLVNKNIILVNDEKRTITSANYIENNKPLIIKVNYVGKNIVFSQAR